MFLVYLHLSMIHLDLHARQVNNINLQLPAAPERAEIYHLRVFDKLQGKMKKVILEHIFHVHVFQEGRDYYDNELKILPCLKDWYADKSDTENLYLDDKCDIAQDVDVMCIYKWVFDGVVYYDQIGSL